tara:strand:- start:265 stop:579 length:315 start_codon:yes stop_codon:yes gene_type:complete
MRSEWSSPDKEEVVVALQVLAADVNLGYHDWRNWIVDSVNGSSIKNFKEFANLLKENSRDNVVFENKNGYQMVINHSEAMDSESNILQQYRIPAAHSPELFPTN